MGISCTIYLSDSVYYIFAMGSGHELVKLDWRDHGLNASKAFRSLREDSNFCDLTIACEDGVLLSHKVVLFASSLLFKDILKKHTHPHPLVYLKNINSRDMGSLMDFMYFGEVEIQRSQLSSFSAAAKELKVLGLMSKSPKDFPKESLKETMHQPAPIESSPHPDWKVPSDEVLSSMDNLLSSNNNMSVDSSTINTSRKLDESISPSRNQVCRPNSSSTALEREVKFESQLIIEAPIIETQPMFEFENAVQNPPKLPQMTAFPMKISVPGQGWIRKGREQREDAKAHGIKEFKDFKKFVKKCEKVVLKNTGKRLYECTLCGSATVNKGHLLQHIEGKHFPGVIDYTCKLCGRTQGRRESARAHVQRCKGSKQTKPN